MSDPLSARQSLAKKTLLRARDAVKVPGAARPSPRSLPFTGGRATPLTRRSPLLDHVDKHLVRCSLMTKPRSAAATGPFVLDSRVPSAAAHVPNEAACPSTDKAWSRLRRPRMTITVPTHPRPLACSTPCTTDHGSPRRVGRPARRRAPSCGRPPGLPPSHRWPGPNCLRGSGRSCLRTGRDLDTGAARTGGVRPVAATHGPHLSPSRRALLIAGRSGRSCDETATVLPEKRSFGRNLISPEQG